MKLQDTERNLESAGAEIREATRLASQPTAEALDNCADVLGQVRRRLEALTREPLPAEPAARSSARTAVERLSRSLDRLRNLLDHAAGYWAGWIRLRDAMTAGYTGKGEAAPAPRPGRLSLEG